MILGYHWLVRSLRLRFLHVRGSVSTQQYKKQHFRVSNARPRLYLHDTDEEMPLVLYWCCAHHQCSTFVTVKQDPGLAEAMSKQHVCKSNATTTGRRRNTQHRCNINTMPRKTFRCHDATPMQHRYNTGATHMQHQSSADATHWQNRFCHDLASPIWHRV